MGVRARAFFTALPDPADHPVFRIEPHDAPRTNPRPQRAT
jgi:hypothetical protein